jgi:2-iminobutanoate/2-iminopropanoate deaminase
MRSPRFRVSLVRLAAAAALLAVAAVAVPISARAEVERINVDELGRLPAFSHATVASGQLVFIAGTLGTRPGAREVVPGGVGPQTQQALENIGRILAAAHTSPSEVLKCTVYLTDMTKFAEMNEVWIPFFGGQPPARATIGVSALALDAAVEIECIAQRTIATAGGR